MQKGFTLIELLAVVLIVSILTSVAVPQYRKSLERTRVAEARQMLPAIYDSVERLATESLCNSWSACSDKLVFSKLDLEMKGKAVTGQPAVWKTANFEYHISTTNTYVYAYLLKGRWKNVRIEYDGEKFGCVAGNSVSAKYKNQVCSLLDFSKKDQGE